MNDPKAEYERRLVLRRDRVEQLQHRHLVISNLRLALFVTCGVILWLALARSVLSAAWVLAPAFAFGVLLVVHARLLNRAERSRRAHRLYERGLARLEGRWVGIGNDGLRFLGDHPYARDLDLFGRGSLFELLNNARTETGEATLADWLKQGSGIDEVRARQAAVDELRNKLDFREDLAVLAAEGVVSRTGAVAAWAERSRA